MNVTFTRIKKAKFLAALAETCNVTKSAEKAGVSRMVVYQHRAADNDFSDKWAQALLLGAEALEDEARRRAFEGVEEPVFYQGIATGSVKKFSDTLAIFLLKGAMPEKYRDNSKVELAGHLAVTDMTEEEIRAELAALTVSTPKPQGDDGGD